MQQNVGQRRAAIREAVYGTGDVRAYRDVRVGGGFQNVLAVGSALELSNMPSERIFAP